MKIQTEEETSLNVFVCVCFVFFVVVFCFVCFLNKNRQAITALH